MDESKLSDSSEESLKALAQLMIDNNSVKIEIIGHTNSTPSHEYCDKLSSDRAQSVRQYFISNGANPDNIEAKGAGKREPKYSEFSAAGRTSNQRVEVKILAL